MDIPPHFQYGMSRYVELHCCPICGVRVGPEHERPEDGRALWAQNYRALYADARTGYQLSEECKRVDASPDRSYNIHPSSNAGDMAADQPTNALGAGNQPAYNNRRGFVLHSHCYYILSMANGPAPVPIQRMFNVCSSLPIVDNLLNWGRGYRGLSGGPGAPNPPPYHENVRLFTPRGGNQFIECDPIPESHSALFSGVPDSPPSWPAGYIENRTRDSEDQDLFSRLPYELIRIIALQMRTEHVLQMRQASRAFWPVLHDQSFWKSRFGPGSERTWLFSVYDASEHSWLFDSFSEEERQHWLTDGAWQPGDWRSLWLQTRWGTMGPNLKNLRRVWALAKAILAILNTPAGPTRDAGDLPREISGGQWRTHEGKIQRHIDRAMITGDGYEFTEGCRLLYSLHARVMETMYKITFYFVDAYGSRLLAGIMTTDSFGREQLMGYETRKAKGFGDHTLGGTFRGFTVASRAEGIVAVRVHYGKQVSKWYGDDVSRWLEGGVTSRLQDPAGPVILRELVVSGRLEQMEVGFDGFKIVRIGVHGMFQKP
ncbi:unnamed protein product [Clonostachys rosea]|uniref:F-box domain-containing protein n=1 Tax=Bionectria ochroleuca TaxID=29856 RepID=A0ABY6TQH7_BIOOC|nr:unnamed protein product [Clonostachys rosea]